MPDENKLEVLRQIGYAIKPVCATCKYARFAAGSAFGSCQEHTYKHAKHTGPLRDLSIHVAGSCDEHLLALEVEERLEASGFLEFIP